jgi:hypothetical protein
MKKWCFLTTSKIINRVFFLFTFYTQIICIQCFIICENTMKSVIIISFITLVFHTACNLVSIFVLGNLNISNNIYNSFIDAAFIIVTILGSIRNRGIS